MRLRPTDSDADGRLATAPQGGGPAQPPPPDLDQRRFDLRMIGLMLVLAALLVGGVVVYLHFHDQAVARERARADAAARAAAARAAEAQKVAEVKQAYLDYDAALSRMEQQVSLTPLQPYLTAAGLRDEQNEFQQIQASGYHYLLESQHNVQVVLYAGGQLASVDDNEMQHMTPLDPNTMTAASPTMVRPIHASYAMKLENGRWLVDSVVTFGSDGSDPALGLSYAATNADQPLNDDVRKQIHEGYETYWGARTQAYQNLDAAPLRDAILPGGALDKDLSVLGLQIQRKQGFAIRVEHNERIALKDPNTAYVYDTIADSSYFFDFATKQRLGPLPTTLLRETHELKKVGGHWKVDMVATDTSK